MKKHSLLVLLFITFTINTFGQYPFSYLKPNGKKGWNLISINQLIMKLIPKYGNENSLCLAEKLQQNYSSREAQDWTIEERENALTPFLVDCVYPEIALEQETRKLAFDAMQAKQYAEAIPYFLDLVEDSVADVHDFNGLGWCYLVTKQYQKALKYLKQGELLDESDLYIQGNLANAYLLSHDEEKAMVLYKKYKGYNIDATKSWEAAVLEDIATFEKLGIKNEHFEEIKQLMKGN